MEIINPFRTFGIPSTPWLPSEIDLDAWYDAADEATILGAAGELGVLDVDALPINPNTGKPWQVGDKYRLMFVSSGVRDGSSATIADYNTFIQNLATAAGLGTGWTAVVSTATVDAKDNTNTDPGSDTDSAVILMDGAQVAFLKLSDMWPSSSWARVNIDLDEDGNLRPNDTPIWTSWCAVWTGTRWDGTAENPLGNGGNTNLGLARAEQQFWIDRGVNTDTYDLPIYGISPLLTVEAADVSLWQDKANQQRDLVQATVAAQPTSGARTQNGLNVLDCDGGDFMAKTAFPIDASGDHAVIGVVLIDSVDDANDSLWSADAAEDYQLDAANASQFDGEIDATGGTNVALTGGPYTGAHMFASIFDFTGDTEISARVDGEVNGTPQTYSTKLSASQTLRMFADRAGTAIPDGAMAEFIVITDLTLANIQKIEGYLAWKWGIQALLPIGHPYKGHAPTRATRAWTPKDAGEPLEAWWDTADSATISDTAGAVDQIDDKSGRENDATQSGGNRPTTGTRTIGGENVFDYVGASSQHLDFGSAIDMIGKEMWCVINIDALVADFTCIGGSNTQNTVLTTGLIRNWGSASPWSPTDTKAAQTAVIATDYILGFLSHIRTSQKQFSVDGVLTDNAGLYRYPRTLGMNAIADNQYAHAADGMIGEIVIVDGELTEADRQRMEGYFAWKWGQESKLPGGHPYKDAAPTI
jgi:hypothetical protein